MGSCHRLFLSRPVNRPDSEISVGLIPDNAEMQSQLAKPRSKVQLPGLRCVPLQILVVLVSTVWVSSAPPCWSQAVTGSIVGTVTDASGAVVPQAAITATNVNTGVISSATADSSGHYNLLSLPAGAYTVSAAQTGFDTARLSGISLSLYQQITLNIVLKVGMAKQTVTVEVAPTLVDTTSASLGTVVSQAAILDMPLDLREVGALALLVPGTVNTTGRSLATGAANGSGFNDIGFSGSGAVQAATYF